MAEGPAFPLRNAETLANELVEVLQVYCERSLVVGSIRRSVPMVRDIDIVAQSRVIPNRAWFGAPTEVSSILPRYVNELIVSGVLMPRTKKDGKTMVGEKVAFVSFKGIPVDLYYATPDTWGGLVLIRTGSVEHNIRMVTRAKSQGWKLHASGEGLFDEREGGKRLDDGTEESFFRLLDMAYVPPEGRIA